MATIGGLLPPNALNLSMEGSNDDPSHLMVAGNLRANIHPPMLALQTLFVREHNRLATALFEANPLWSDEHLFQEARKFNIALLQSICFQEYLPMLGIELDLYQGYRKDIDPSLDNFFSSVAFRFGHSAVNDILFRVDDEGQEIRDGHFVLSLVTNDPKAALNSGIEPILRGLSMKTASNIDLQFAPSMTDYLFGTPKFGAVDLFAMDIQRGRDHGIPDYNTVRSVRCHSFIS